MKTMLARQIRLMIPVLLYSFMSSVHYPWTTANLDYFRSSDDGLSLSDSDISLITSAMHFGRLLLAALEILVLKRMGRKKHFIASALLMLVATPLYFIRTTVWVLSVVRFLVGMSIGLGDMAMHMYIGETVSKKFRGAFITTTSIVFSIGIMLTYAAPIFFHYHYILLMVLAVNVLLFLCVFDLVESPYFLSACGLTEKATENIKWLNDCTTKQAEDELKIMSDHVDKVMSVDDLIRDFRKPEIYKSLCIVISVGVFTTLLSTVTTCFANLVFPRMDAISSSEFAIGFSALVMLVTCGASLIVDRYGRRILLLWGFTFQTVAQAGIALLYFLHDNYHLDIANFPQLMFACITITFLGFQFGCQVPYGVVRGEIFPTNLKNVGIGTNVIFNSLSNTIFSYFFLPIIETFGIYVNFLIFSVSSLAGLLIVAALLPETKKKSLIEIQLMLRKS